jgi:hypothetical protein
MNVSPEILKKSGKCISVLDYKLLFFAKKRFLRILPAAPRSGEEQLSPNLQTKSERSLTQLSIEKASYVF